MSDIAIFHDRLDLFGGGEAVCTATIEALQDEHELTVFTRALPPVAELDEFYGTTIDRSTVRFRTGRGRSSQRTLARLGEATDRRLGIALQSLRRAAFVRWVQRETRDADLVVSTAGEFPFEPPTVVYYHKHDLPATDTLDRGRRWLSALLTSGAGTARPDGAILANSDWTADRVARDYGTRPTVCYPPVDTTDLPAGRPWPERESGFVTVGRIAPEKNVLRNVEIVERLSERGHDVHLHIVGPAHDRRYTEQVERRASDLEFVTYEGKVDRDRLLSLLGSHRYGLHGREPEHFGIAVAEQVASGMLPFVPDSGGQREVVGELPALLYSSAEEAVDSISTVLDSGAEQDRLREQLPDVESAFGRERFRRTIRSVVDSVLAAERPAATPTAGS
ncbi:glycosyltransferase family 4 protein [Haloarchaeobius baliensis]|uniref:glycosyltransferase family 4 protein n=1 Tax=Haloarchaeobius baliensis TaxID=1670458 RepID=UPI003F881306